jgi:hypothetical protein
MEHIQSEIRCHYCWNEAPSWCPRRDDSKEKFIDLNECQHPLECSDHTECWNGSAQLKCNRIASVFWVRVRLDKDKEFLPNSIYDKDRIALCKKHSDGFFLSIWTKAFRKVSLDSYLVHEVMKA